MKARVTGAVLDLAPREELVFTARVEGALFHRAASASKKSGEGPR